MFLRDSPVSLPLLHPYPNEERAHLSVSLRETNLRLPARSVRLPLFPFSRAEAARLLSGIKAEAEARPPSKSLGAEKGPELGDWPPDPDGRRRVRELQLAIYTPHSR